MVNKWIGIGNLIKDVELRHTQAGMQVASFHVACNEKYKDKQGAVKESVEYVSIVAWDKLAEICKEYLHKGSKVYIEGKLQTRKWQDKDGHDRWTTEIVARDMKMLAPKGGEGGGDYSGDPGPAGGSQAHHSGSTANSDVPF